MVPTLPAAVRFPYDNQGLLSLLPDVYTSPRWHRFQCLGILQTSVSSLKDHSSWVVCVALSIIGSRFLLPLLRTVPQQVSTSEDPVLHRFRWIINKPHLTSQAHCMLLIRARWHDVTQDILSRILVIRFSPDIGTQYAQYRAVDSYAAFRLSAM